MAGSDLLGIVIVGAIVLGGIYMIQQGGGLENLLGGLGGGQTAPIEEAPEEEATPAEEPEPTA